MQGKRGKGGGFVKATLKNLSTGFTHDKTFTSDETVEHADMERQVASYSWADTTDESLVFMHVETFEEIRIPKSLVENSHFLVGGQEVKLLKFRDAVLGVEIPVISEYEVTEVDPSKEHGGNMMATIQTGHALWVPVFIKPGTRIRINTQDNLYVDRAP